MVCFVEALKYSIVKGLEVVRLPQAYILDRQLHD
jgi:hypothetical protein